MLKIFLTGDNHIGLKYASHPRAAELIGARMNAFDGMVARANEENCDLFVISGDLFDNGRSIPKKDIGSLLEKLSDFHGTVVVLPGNHDYYDPELKLWKDFQALMSHYDNIMLLSEYRPYELMAGDSRVVLYPAHCTSLHSAPSENNLGWIKAAEIPQDDAYRIGLAHGAVEGETIDKEGAYFQMSRQELMSIPVDAWLIGHTHVPFPRDLQEVSTPVDQPIFNAGTHVQANVNNNTPGLCFVIEINEDKTVRAKKVVSGNLCFCRRELTVSAGKMKEQLVQALADVTDHAVVEVSLRGAVSAAEYEDRRAIIDGVMSRFLEYTYTDTNLSKLITQELVESEFPETSFSAGLLTALLDDPKEAQMAYELLKSLKEDK